VNSIIITGRLGRDVELGKSDSGTSWAAISVAECREDPNWFDVKCFNRTFDVLDECGSKGLRERYKVA
jgi:single-stranded DNA-binding protein